VATCDRRGYSPTGITSVIADDINVKGKLVDSLSTLAAMHSRRSVCWLCVAVCGVAGARVGVGIGCID